MKNRLNRTFRFWFYFFHLFFYSFAFFFFYLKFNLFLETLHVGNLESVLLIIVTVVTVHSLKSLRLYLSMSTTSIRLSSYLRIYCKVTPISMLLPFKLGDIFRVYCYGRTIRSQTKAFFLILQDRFIDTFALILILVLSQLFIGGQTTLLTFVLLFFVFFVLALYIIFPSLYFYWKNYLIETKSTPNKIKMLRSLRLFYQLYSEIEFITKGRGLIQLFLSLCAWSIEVSVMVVFLGTNEFNSGILQNISNYLSAALGAANVSEIETSKFMIISVFLIAFMYVWIKFHSLFKERGRVNK